MNQPGLFPSKEALDEDILALSMADPSPVDRLLIQHLPHVIQLFRSKARDYSDNSGVFTADLLGSRGQFGDIWRKIPKLKKALWDGEELAGEQAEEILADLIGHCMLAIDYLASDE